MHSEIEIESSYGGTTYASSKQHVYNYDLTTFYKTTILSLQTIHFHSNVIKVVLGLIPKFDNIISEMKNNKMDETPSSPNGNSKHTLHLKYLYYKINIGFHEGTCQ